jgi:hypothetical protein
MIRVVMGDEDLSKVTQRKARENQLASDAISAIDDVNSSTGNDCLSAARSLLSRSRPSGSTKEN